MDIQRTPHSRQPRPSSVGPTSAIPEPTIESDDSSGPLDAASGSTAGNTANNDADNDADDDAHSTPHSTDDNSRIVHLGSAAGDREILIRGRRAFERGDDTVALESLTRVIAHGFEYADVYYMIGMLHERRDDLEASLHSLRRAIRINPSYVEALLALATLHERRGDFDQSQSYAERGSRLAKGVAGSLDPTTRGKLANQQAELGDALAEAGESRDAVEQYRRALDRCPTFHDVRHRLGITLRDAGLPSQAAQEFRRILRVHPSMLESQIQLGLTYYSMGRTPEAIAEWDAVLERDPSRDEARMYLRLVRGAKHRAAVPAEAGLTASFDIPDRPDNSDNSDTKDDLESSRWSTSALTASMAKPTT